MAEVTNELMYEVLRQLQSDMAGVKDSLREHGAAMHAIRLYLAGLQQDTQNIYASIARQDLRLERIERRLEIAEAPASVP